MNILVDYACAECGSIQERWVLRPAPKTAECVLCRAETTRRFGIRDLHVRRSSSVTSRTDNGGAMPFTVENRDVPGICHMSATESRRWVALARGDQRAERREVERQERAIESGQLDPNRVVAHHHGLSAPGSTPSKEGN